MTVGERIKERRIALDLSQEELAHRLGLRGRSSVSKAEKSGDTMTPTLIKAYADALDCSVLYLMGYDDAPVDTNYTIENAQIVSQIRYDSNLLEALKVYFSLPEDKKKYAVKLIKMLADQIRFLFQ